MFYKLILTLIFFTVVAVNGALADNHCAALEPRGGQDLSQSAKGKIEGEVEGIISRIAGAAANVDGEFISEMNDTLKEYPDAHKLYIWERVLFLMCAQPDTDVDLNKLLLLVMQSATSGIKMNIISNTGDGSAATIGSGNTTVIGD